MNKLYEIFFGSSLQPGASVSKDRLIEVGLVARSSSSHKDIMTNEKPVPSNINFGLLPPVTLTKEQRRDRKNKKKIKKQLAAERARNVLECTKGMEQ